MKQSVFSFESIESVNGVTVDAPLPDSPTEPKSANKEEVVDPPKPKVLTRKAIDWGPPLPPDSFIDPGEYVGIDGKRFFAGFRGKSRKFVWISQPGTKSIPIPVEAACEWLRPAARGHE